MIMEVRNCAVDLNDLNSRNLQRLFDRVQDLQTHETGGGTRSFSIEGTQVCYKSRCARIPKFFKTNGQTVLEFSTPSTRREIYGEGSGGDTDNQVRWGPLGECPAAKCMRTMIKTICRNQNHYRRPSGPTLIRREDNPDQQSTSSDSFHSLRSSRACSAVT